MPNNKPDMPSRSPRRRAPARVDTSVTCVQSNVLAHALAARARTQPRMQALHRLLVDLAETSSKNTPKAPWDYEIEGFGTLRTKFLQDFCATVDNATQPQQVELCMWAVGSKSLSTLPKSAQAFARMTDYLVRHGLRYDGSTVGGLSKIIVKPMVRVALTVTADADGSAIRTELRNLNALGDVRYAFEPEAIDTRFMNAIVDLLLRRSADFYELTGNVVSGATPEAASGSRTRDA